MGQNTTGVNKKRIKGLSLDEPLIGGGAYDNVTLSKQLIHTGQPGSYLDAIYATRKRQEEEENKRINRGEALSRPSSLNKETMDRMSQPIDMPSGRSVLATAMLQGLVPKDLKFYRAVRDNFIDNLGRNNASKK
jgi:hypothetical protein